MGMRHLPVALVLTLAACASSDPPASVAAAEDVCPAEVPPPGCPAFPHTILQRVNGNCAVVDCCAGWGDCDNGTPGAVPGCETDMTTASNCGACGLRCATGTACSVADGGAHVCAAH